RFPGFVWRREADLPDRPCLDQGRDLRRVVAELTEDAGPIRAQERRGTPEGRGRRLEVEEGADDLERPERRMRQPAEPRARPKPRGVEERGRRERRCCG